MSNIILPAGSKPILEKNTFFVEDDILSLNTSLEIFGTEIIMYSGGSAGAGNIAGVPSLPEHPGVVMLTTGSTSGQARWAFCGDIAEIADHITAFSFLVRPSNTTSQLLQCGVGINQSADDLGNDSIVFEHDSAASANWRFVCKAGGGAFETVVDTGVAVAALSWYLLHAELNGAGEWVPSINDVAYTAVSTNIPASLSDGGPAIRLKTTAAGSKQVSLDYLDFTIEQSGARY